MLNSNWQKPEQLKSWIRLRRIQFSRIPEFLGTFFWSLRARTLNPSWHHYVNCITELCSCYFRPMSITFHSTGIVESYIWHFTLVWTTNIVITTTKIISSEFVWMDIGYQCPSASIYAITCCNNDLLCGECWTGFDPLLTCQSSEVLH